MSIYKQPSSPNWYANIEVPSVPRLRRSTGTADRKEAQRIHDQWKAELWALRPADVGPGHSWSEAVELWLDQEERSESELLSLAKLGKRYPDRGLDKCTAESFEQALDFCKTAGTYTRYRTMVTAILNLAATKKWIAAVPVIAQKKDKKKKRRDWITRDQWKRLYAELPPHLKVSAEFALETGMRQANVLGLRWEQVDLDRCFAWVEAEDTKDDDALPVPLSDRAVQILKDQKARVDVVEAVAKKLLGLATKDYVFTFRGKPISDVKTAFMAACKRAGLGEHRKVDGKTQWVGFTWHGLRHTWATWHVQNGTPLDVLQKLGGWSDLRMVQNYAHHSPGHLARFANNASGKGSGPAAGA